MQKNYNDDEIMFDNYMQADRGTGREQFIPKSRAKNYLKYVNEDEDLEYFPEFGTKMQMEGQPGLVTVVGRNEKKRSVTVELEDETRVFNVSLELLTLPS